MISAWQDIQADHAAERPARKRQGAAKNSKRATTEQLDAPRTKATSRRQHRHRPRRPAPAKTKRRPKRRRNPRRARRRPEAGAGGRRRRRRHPAAASASRLGAATTSRPRPRDVAAAGGAEAPGQLGGLGDADPGAGDDLRRLQPRRAASSNGLASEVGARSSRARRRAPRSACRAPSRARASCACRRRGAARISSMPSVGSSARIRTAAACPPARRRS